MEMIDPPESKRRPYSDHWVNVVSQLKNNHPGKWGLAGNYSVGVASHIRKGEYPAFLIPGLTDKKTYIDRHWEITTRRTPDGRNDVYVRWVGQGCTCKDCV